MTFDLKVKHLLENVLWGCVVCTLSRFLFQKKNKIKKVVLIYALHLILFTKQITSFKC